MNLTLRTLSPILVALAAACGPAHAGDDPHAAHRAAMQAASGGAETRVVLPDVVLRDADGRPFPLRPDSFGGRVVVVDFVFTTCTTICPALTTLMASVKRGLGERMGREVVLVSISVDPARDTPEVLRAYARRVGAGDDWIWLTGSSGDIARVLRAFGLAPGAPDDHPPLIMVGDPARDRWLRWVGVPSPATLVERARELSAQHRASPEAAVHDRPGASNAHPSASP